LSGQVEPLQLARLVAVISMGTEIIRLRRMAHRLGLDPDIDEALDAVAQGNTMIAMERMAEIDRILTELPAAGPRAADRLRARGSIRAIQEVLAHHASYFDSGVPR